MPRSQPREELTIDQAKEALGVETRQGVQYLIDAGKLPGARKVDPEKITSPWLIPVESIEAFKKQRAKAEKT